MEFEITLPWPPSVNHYKKVGGIIKTKSGKTYQKRVNSRETTGFYYQVYNQAKLTMPIEWVKQAAGEEISFEVYIGLHPPDKRRRDVDNSLKVLLDSLVHAKIIHDDSQIIKLSIEKKSIVDKGKVIVKINTIQI